MISAKICNSFYKKVAKVNFCKISNPARLYAQTYIQKTAFIRYSLLILEEA